MSPTPPADQAGGGIDSGPAARTGSASGTCVDHIVVLGEAQRPLAPEFHKIFLDAGATN